MDPNQQYQQYSQPPGMPPVAPLTANSGKHHKPWGLIIALILFVLLFISALGFGFWAYSGRQQYKNEADKITAKAVAVAKLEEATKKDSEFTEKEKNPYKKYEGPDTYGGLDIVYPKTWSAYVVQADRTGTPVDGYFHPGHVPDIKSETAFALRVQVTSQSYEHEMKQFEGKVKSGKVKVTAYAPKNVAGVVGSRVEGEIRNGQKNTMVLIPIRDKTIKLSTESPQFAADFENIILANLKFTP